MIGEDIPRFKVRALPPIGRREPGSSISQLARALAVMSCAFVTVAAIADSRHGGAARHALSAMMVHRG